MIRVVLAQPRGFCAGVERAIEIVERALKKYGPPIYVRHEIVHNRHVVEDLRTRGAVFVDELDEIPPGAMTIFSAHGVAKQVEQTGRRAASAGDRRHLSAGRQGAQRGPPLRLPGPRDRAGRPCRPRRGGGHDRPGAGQGAPGADGGRRRRAGRSRDPDKLAYITQTTLSVDDTRGIIAALKARFPSIVGPDVRDICYATQNRQQAVRDLAGEVDMILVVGSRNSSNSNRLREIGEELGKPVLPDRRRRRAASGMVRRRALGRRHRRRIGAGDAGAGRAGRAAPVRRHRRFHLGRRGGGRALPLPQRTGRHIEDCEWPCR